MKNIFKVLVVLISVICMTMLSAYVFTQLWAWFISPICEIRQLSLPEAVGILTLLNWLLPGAPHTIKSLQLSDPAFWSMYADAASKTAGSVLSAWAIGYIVTLFM